MTDQQNLEPEDPSPFIRWLREHLEGETLEELDQSFTEICAASSISGRKTALTLKVDVDQKGRTLVIKSDVATKIPPPPRDADVFFPDNEGHLHRSDPNAPKLPFNVVQFDTEPPREIDRSTGEIKTVGGES